MGDGGREKGKLSGAKGKRDKGKLPRRFRKLHSLTQTKCQFQCEPIPSKFQFQSNNASVKIRLRRPIPIPSKAESYQYLGCKSYVLSHWKAKFQSNVDCTSLGRPCDTAASFQLNSCARTCATLRYTLPVAAVALHSPTTSKT